MESHSVTSFTFTKGIGWHFKNNIYSVSCKDERLNEKVELILMCESDIWHLI